MRPPEDDVLDDDRDHDQVAPECRATVDAIQSVLDGAAPAGSLDADPHATACATCRERVRAVRVLLPVLAAPREPVAVPAGFTERMVAVWDENHAHRHGRLMRVPKALTALAIAAAILVVAFVLLPPSLHTNRPSANKAPAAPLPAPEVTPAPEAAPAPRERAPAPPRPMRIGDEVAKAGQALRDTPKPIADSVAVAPKLYEAFASAFRPAAPAAPMGDMLEPARKSLAELPDAARSGLEPVTGTAQKAFDRLLRDVALVKPKS